jgi:SAM-dependent methyltransferase
MLDYSSEDDYSLMGKREQQRGKREHDYSSAVYWDKRYETSTVDEVEWLYGCQELSPLIKSFMQKSDSILIPGCGNAPFSADLHGMGYTNQVNIDISPCVIKQMSTKHRDCAGMHFKVMDVCDLGFFDDEVFDTIFDKAMFDTLLCSDEGEAAKQKKCMQMVEEMYRVLKPGGVYIIVSLNATEEVLPMLVKDGEAYCALSWVCSRIYIEQSSSSSSSSEDGSVDGSTSSSSSSISSNYQVVVCKKMERRLQLPQGMYFRSETLSESGVDVALVSQQELDEMAKGVQSCVLTGTCTFGATGNKFSSQKWYKCSCSRGEATGNEATETGLCFSCALACHSGPGHTLKLQPTSQFYCDCGAGEDDDGAPCFPRPCQCNGIIGAIRHRRAKIRQEPKPDPIWPPPAVEKSCDATAERNNRMAAVMEEALRAYLSS